MGEIYGDFCGFTFNGFHSSDFNIVRVSGGSRYNSDTLPNFQDKTTSVPGMDGLLYFKTDYQQKTFSISIAFDSMTEMNYRNFRQVFNGKTTGDLIFDELPYKVYSAKLQNSPQLKTICFDKNDGSGRVYKGEGTINFVCYYPFARSRYKYLDQYSSVSFPNKNEWKDSSMMLPTQGIYDGSGTHINIYNPGDVPTDWVAYYSFNSSTISTFTIVINGSKQITVPEIEKKQGDTSSGFYINSRTGLIGGYNESNNIITKNNIIYGSIDSIKIPNMGTLSGTFDSGLSCNRLEYNYLYY